MHWTFHRRELPGNGPLFGQRRSAPGEAGVAWRQWWIDLAPSDPGWLPGTALGGHAPAV